jgi:ribosomal protein L11 methyltransferase
MQPTILTPDSTLFIYYLEGRIAKDEKIVNQNYLGNWEEDGFSFLFFLEPSPETIDRLTARQGNLTLIDTYEMSYEQWQGGKLEPRQVGSFLLTPPWFTPPEGEPSTIITLNPGVVFGNGLHPTTQDCLQAIEIACAGQKVETMLDLGTGTGVLAIAAAKHGCSRILAVDYNLLASQTARFNAQLNSLENNILVINGKAEDYIATPSDLLVANIHYDIMQGLVQSQGFLKQKWFILSGLLKSEADKVENHLKDLPVLLLKKWCSDSIWHTFLGITEQN